MPRHDGHAGQDNVEPFRRRRAAARAAALRPGGLERLRASERTGPELPPRNSAGRVRIEARRPDRERRRAGPAEPGARVDRRARGRASGSEAGRAIPGRAHAPALVLAGDDPRRGAPALARAARACRRASGASGRRALRLPASRRRRAGPDVGSRASAGDHRASSGRDRRCLPPRARRAVRGALQVGGRAPASRTPAERHPQRRQRLQHPGRSSDRKARGPPGHGASRFRRHGRDVDGLRARGRRGLRRLRPARGPRGRGARRGRLPLAAPALGGGAGCRLDPGCDAPLHERLSFRAPPHGRAREPLSARERSPGLGSPRPHGRNPSAFRPSRSAKCLRLPALPADSRDRGLASKAPRRIRTGRRGRPRPGRGLRPVRRQPRVPDSGRDPRHRDHDAPALFEDARGGDRRRDRPLRRSPAHLRRRRVRPRDELDRRRAPRAPHRAHRPGHLHGARLARARSAGRPRARRPRQRRALRLRPDRHPRARARGRSPLLHAVRSPGPRLPRVADSRVRRSRAGSASARSGRLRETATGRRTSTSRS